MKLLNLIEESKYNDMGGEINKKEEKEKKFNIISDIGIIKNKAKIDEIGLDRLIRRMCLDNNISIEDILKVDGKQAIRLDKVLIQSDFNNYSNMVLQSFKFLVDCKILNHISLRDRYELYTFADKEYGCEFVDYYGNIVLYAYIDRIDYIVNKLNQYIHDKQQEFKYKKFFHWYF